jgi:putative hydrolase of the HAD superfamily
MGMVVLYSVYNTPMRFTTFFFDLDDTLYPPSTGLWGRIGGRINLYLHERMGFPAGEVQAIREKYFREYGTTLRGLQADYQVDMDDYLAFVHDIPLRQYIQPNPALRTAIEKIPARKYIFTNADTNHARRVTDVVGLQGIFDGIIDVHSISPYCKPMPEAFELALKKAGNPDPNKCVLLDDQTRITRAARLMGMFTILVGKELPGEDADTALLQLTDLPHLFNGHR